VIVCGDAWADLEFEVIHLGNALDCLVVEAFPVGDILSCVSWMIQFPCFFVVEGVVIPVAGIRGAVPSIVLSWGASPGVGIWGDRSFNDWCAGPGGSGPRTVYVVPGAASLPIGHLSCGGPSGS
jgi:hypothetical protein